jgi:Asp-tRNA(Asn)/Glu-tRNA(Gln) amidotransferase A subunit family amidase
MSQTIADTDLLYTPAAKAAALIRSRKLSPVEYVDTVLKAAERANPRLNCFREVMTDAARRDAKAAEQAVMDGKPASSACPTPLPTMPARPPCACGARASATC